MLFIRNSSNVHDLHTFLQQFTHFFRQYFWAEKLTPPICSLLGCMEMITRFSLLLKLSRAHPFSPTLAMSCLSPVSDKILPHLRQFLQKCFFSIFSKVFLSDWYDWYILKEDELKLWGALIFYTFGGRCSYVFWANFVFTFWPLWVRLDIALILQHSRCGKCKKLRTR